MTPTPDLLVPETPRDDPGHTFVVNGVLEGLGWDAAIVPTDSVFEVSDIWKKAAGLTDADPWSPLRPDAWGRGSSRRAKREPDDKAAPLVWFLDVASPSADELGSAAADCVRAMVAADREELAERARRAHRAKPLVALPVIGVRGGGHGPVRGAVIRGLLAAATGVAREAGVDVVIVARSRADYAALQHGRVGAASTKDATAPFDGPLVEHAKRLGEKASRGELALFIGAGVSMSAGLPSWSALIDRLAESPEAKTALVGIDLAKHGPLEQATLLDAVAREPLDAGSREHDSPLGSQIAAIIQETTTPGLSHALLAGLRCREVVTTNYDKLYETAVDAILPETVGPVEPSRKVAVAPWDRPSADAAWILKMHGDIDHPASIVLTRGSFVRYDAHWKPVGAIVQSLMMTRHLLVLGASMTDDNLVRFAHEVGELRDGLAQDPASAGGDGAPEIGTIVTLFDSPALRKLWAGRFDVLGATDVPVPERDAGDREVQEEHASRELSIFLDVMGMYAIRDASYLLDRRYARPEEEDEKGSAVAERLRALAPDLAGLVVRYPRGDWAKLATALAQFGLEIRSTDDGTPS